jgi:hypothetical protein
VRVAAGVTEILDEVYRRNRDLSEERARELAGDVAHGRVLLFVLMDSDRRVVATTAFTRVDQVFPSSRVSSYEAGRTAKRPGAPPRLAADLIGASFSWAAGHLWEADYLVAHARVAHAAPGRPYNGGILGRLLGYQFIHLPGDTASRMLGAMLDESTGARVAYATRGHGFPPVIPPGALGAGRAEPRGRIAVRAHH